MRTVAFVFERTMSTAMRSLLTAKFYEALRAATSTWKCKFAFTNQVKEELLAMTPFELSVANTNSYRRKKKRNRLQQAEREVHFYTAAARINEKTSGAKKLGLFIDFQGPTL